MSGMNDFLVTQGLKIIQPRTRTRFDLAMDLALLQPRPTKCFGCPSTAALHDTWEEKVFGSR